MIGTKEAFRNQGILVGSNSYEDSMNSSYELRQKISERKKDKETPIKTGCRTFQESLKADSK